MEQTIWDPGSKELKFLGARVPYSLYVRCDGDLFFCESSFIFLLKS